MGNQPDATKKVARGRRGQGTPSIVAVARRAGVSIATVSRVVNGIPNKASEQTLARVQEAIAALNYRPIRAGIALRTKTTRLVALLMPDITNSFYGDIAAAVEQALAQDGHAMILCITGGRAAVQDSYLLEMQAHMVRGIALFGAIESPELSRFVAEGEPLLFVNRRPPKGLKAPYVGVDNGAAGRDVARYFLKRGWERIAILHGPAVSLTSQDRLRGFQEVMTGADRRVPRALIRASDLTIESGYRQAISLFKQKLLPEAIFCGNDLIAYGVYRRCRELGLRVPEDVFLFGFDDNPLNQWIAPWLSTVRVPAAEFGPAVRDLFWRVWEPDEQGEPPQIILPHELVLR